MKEMLEKMRAIGEQWKRLCQPTPSGEEKSKKKRIFAVIALFAALLAAVGAVVALIRRKKRALQRAADDVDSMYDETDFDADDYSEPEFVGDDSEDGGEVDGAFGEDPDEG